MAYHVYDTRALIIKVEEQGESSSILTLLTADLGLIRARAQGIRYIKSKLRYHASLFSIVDTSLVRGREWWRIVGIRNSVGLSRSGPHYQDIYRVASRVSQIISKIVDGEATRGDDRLFLSLLYFHQALEVGEIEIVEAITMYRVLYILGYIDPRNHLALIDIQPIELDMIKHATSHYKEIIGEINRGLKSIGV